MRTCLFEAMTDVLGRHAQSGHAGELPDGRVRLFKTPEDFCSAHLQPYTIRAERWSAMRTCLYEAMTDVWSRHTQTRHPGGYMSSALLFSIPLKTAWALTCTHTPLARIDRLSCGHVCDNTPSQHNPVFGRESHNVSSGSPVRECPPRNETPKSTHARRRPGESSPSEKHEFRDRKFTCPGRGLRGGHPASPSYTSLGLLPDGPPVHPPP